MASDTHPSREIKDRKYRSLGMTFASMSAHANAVATNELPNDTNVLVSALTLPGGRGDHAVRKIIEGGDSLALSRFIIDELLSVLARKFGYDREELARVALFLADLGELVETTEPVAVLTDEPDNSILECALAAAARVIVTGDRAMLARGEFRDIRIVSPSAYLD